MFSLLKKEIIQFFGSITGYLVAVIFLITTGLFLWVFGGNFNIPDGGYATLDGLFELAPWIYLFLIPAVTMRSFAEEKHSGTLELLLTRPLSELQLVITKFLSALIIVLITLFPTLIYFLSVYLLGNPVGSIDSGAALGSYLGLFFLAVIYLTIGIFTSSVTENQIVSFILAVFLCFTFYSGFDFISGLTLSSNLSDFLTGLGINSHYESISRGVLDSRDLFYFIFTSGLFLIMTRIVLEWKRHPLKKSLILLFVYCAGILLFMAFSQSNFFRIDFTKEKRFTLSSQSKDVLKKVDSPLTAEIYLDGDLPSGFRKLEASVIEHLHDMKLYCDQPVSIKTLNPYAEVKASEQNEYFQNLIRRGIIPTNVRIKTEEGITTKLIFPAVVLRTANKEVVINLLKNNVLLKDEENFIHSMELLEFELTRGIRMLLQGKKEKIAFLQGHGELDEDHLLDFNQSLSENYEISRINADKLFSSSDSIKALIVAAPQEKFPEKDKYILDQYLMKGGRIMWLVDPVNVSLDSLSSGMSTLAFPKDLNLNDLFFQYGVRLNTDLIQDVECLQIKVNTALVGQPPKYSVAPWYFTPLLQPVQSNPVGKNVNRLIAEFVSSLDLVGDSSRVRKSVLLTSSPYARINRSPMIVNLAMIDAPPARELFTRQFIATGALLEGKFSSVFKNRMIDQLGFPAGSNPRINESKETKMMFFTNGRLFANKLNGLGDKMKVIPCGYDPVSNITFGNKDFFINAVNYLCEDSGLMELRSRTMQIRLLDKVRLREEILLWQMFNVIVPVILILILGLIFWFYRHSRN
jgi:ABC-2 type transport system permease protein